MKTSFEIHQDFERKKEEDELKVIIEKPYLTPKEIWEMTPNNFYKWRTKYDFPRILNHFSKKLNDFNKWKAEFGLNDELLISYGISNCISPNPAKDKRKFIVQRTWENQITTFISYQNLDKKFYNLGPNLVNHKVLSTFVGYIDWCNSNDIKILNNWKYNNLISKTSKSSPIELPQENEISILDGLELLKIGNIEIEANEYGLIKPKYFEFVNADFLKLKGKIATGGNQLVFENSFVNNLILEDVDLSLVTFSNCDILDILSINSRIQQWSFNFCNVSGKTFNTDLNIITIYGGNFNLDFKDSTFYDVNARKSNENTYRTFKTIYASQGDDKKAIEYFLLEKAEERDRLKKEIFVYKNFGLFKQTKIEFIIQKIKNSTFNLIKYLKLCINNYYWGYGRKPFRIVGNSAFFILIFALIYFFGQSNMTMPNGQTSMTIWDSLYFSTVTFTTLGYGDFAPLEFMRIIASIEAFVGGISLGFLVAGFSNFKY